MALALFPTREYKITPRLADAAAQCLLRAMTPAPAEGSQALAWGTAIHTLVKLDTRRGLAGHSPLDPEVLVIRGTPHAPWRDDPDYITLATACITGLRAYLAAEELTVLRAEEFVRTKPRLVHGAVDLAVVLSGRIDVVCRRPEGALVLVDMKTGSWVPSDLELATLPSTTIYTLLGEELRRQDEAIQTCTTDSITVVQILPHLAACSSARLTAEELEDGRARVRELIGAMDQEEYRATPGEWCATCPLQAQGCPAWARRRSGGNAVF